MSWVTVVWSMMAAACLTLATVHGVVWWWRREAWANLLFAVTAVAAAFFAAAEMWIMHAMTAEQFATAIRWGHVPLFVLIIALVGFVRLYLNAGRRWLAWTICGGRAFALILNFLVGVNLNYREITEVRQIPFVGEPVSVAVGVANPWILVGQLTGLALLVFVVDASLTVWRRGDRRKALLVGGSIATFVLASLFHSMLVFRGIIPGPLLLSVFFVAIIAAMGFELSRDLLRAAELSNELRESQERMSLAADAANLGMWVWDVSGDDAWMTEQGRALFGFKPDARLDHAAILDRVHPDDRAAREAALKRALETGGEYEMEYRVLTPEGGERWVSARGRCVRAANGKGPKLLGVSMDVTARKKSEFEAAQQRAEFGHLSRVALMGEMAAALAHELNQPLTGIVNNASAGRRFIANGRGDVSKLDSLFEAVTEDGKRAGEILRGIRGMVRKGEEVRQRVELSQVIEDTLRLVRADALARDCTLIVEPTVVGRPCVEADPVQLQQVLLNLIVNACEAMCGQPPEERRVLIRAECDEGDRLRVSVRDFGPGLPVEKPQQIFEQYFSTKREGLGMGLAIARGIITSHGGELNGANAEGGGACFHFTLPACREEGA